MDGYHRQGLFYGAAENVKYYPMVIHQAKMLLFKALAKIFCFTWTLGDIQLLLFSDVTYDAILLFAFLL